MIVFVVCGSRLLSGPANAAGIHSSQVNKVEFCVQIAAKDIVMTSFHISCRPINRVKIVTQWLYPDKNRYLRVANSLTQE